VPSAHGGHLGKGLQAEKQQPGSDVLMDTADVFS